MQGCKPVCSLISFLLTIIIVLTSPITALAEAPSREDILNSAELSAASPQSSELDAYLDELLTDIITDDMTTYEKVKTCYDYLYDNVKYGSHTRMLDTPIGGTSCRKIYNSYGDVEGFGAVALTAGQGMCNAYASAFILMTRKIGLDSYLVSGSTKSGGGGYAYHEWCEMKIGDEIYLFDPQLEQNLTKAGLGEYVVFCKTYEQVPGRYKKSK